MTGFKTDYPTPEESLYYAYVVEVFVCTTCNLNERFPRYNHPIKIFGNFFILICNFM